jgi:predicted TIM-barrel fold metal-dependent hydrolase
MLLRRALMHLGVMWLAVALCATPTDVQSQRPMAPEKRSRIPEKEQSGQPPVQAPVPWVNVHVHLVGGRGPQQDYAGAVDAALREMDRFGIATTIVLPPPQVDAQATHDASDFASAVQRHPGRFAYLGGGGVLNPLIHRYADPARVTDAMKREFAAAAERIIDGGGAGFGEMASLHISHAPEHPYEFVPADHPLFRVLADVAARRDVPIDLHMDAVEGQMPTPSHLAGYANPPTLPDTMGALARLLAYNPKAKIVWAHGGSDPLGAMTATAIGRLMDAHGNLFVSLRIPPAQAPVHNKALTGAGLDPEWQEMFTRHADRFVIGTDAFMVSPSVRGRGPGISFAEKNVPAFHATVRLLSLLPPELARKIGRENAIRLYKLPAR